MICLHPRSGTSSPIRSIVQFGLCGGTLIFVNFGLCFLYLPALLLIDTEDDFAPAEQATLRDDAPHH